MNPVLFGILTRLLCAGLYCLVLSAHAIDHVEAVVYTDINAGVEAGIEANTAPDNHSNPAVKASQTDMASSVAAQQPAQPITTAVAATPVAINATPIGGGQHLVSVTLALLGIIVLIFAISWFVRRFGQGGFAQNQHIKIISTMPLGTRERIVLIDAGGQQLLLGITATAINTLHVYSEPVVLAQREERASDFSRKLMTILQQKSSGSAGEQNNNDNNSVIR